MSAYEPVAALATVNDDQVIWKIRTTHATQAGKVAPWVLTVARYRAIDIARSNRQHVAHRASDPGTVKGRMRVGLQRPRGDFDCVAT